MSEPYKFFAYKEGNHWRGQDLITISQIHSVLRSLNWTREVFASIQCYDANENIVSCPIFIDIDRDDLADAQADAKVSVWTIEYLLNCTPRIYFSGSKGFHLIIERQIQHPRAHELVKHFVHEALSHVKGIDLKVYRTKSMLRIPGSPASKPGFFKVELRRDELFSLKPETIRTIAQNPRVIHTQHDPAKMDQSVWDAWMAQALRELPEFKSLESLRRHSSSIGAEITPCIVRMLTSPCVPGERNATIFILARFFRSCELDETSALNLILEQPHHAAFEAEGREVTKVVRSVYRSRTQSVIGCKSDGLHPTMMRALCAPPCHFRKDFDQNPYVTEFE